MKIGIYSGSFNPIHIGHLMLANYYVEYGGFDEVWMLVSPHNPLRERTLNHNDYHRCKMVQMAVNKIPRIKFSDIEFTLPQPSYTINTLDALRDKYPGYEFTLIIGADNWHIFGKWYESQRIIDDYGVCIYPRRGYEIDEASLPNHVTCVPAPIVEVSSTWIRQGVSEGRNMVAFLPYGVYDYIKENNLYQ